MPGAGRTILEALRAPFQKMEGVRIEGALGYDNGITGVRRAKNSKGGMIDIAGVTENDQPMIASRFTRPGRTAIVFTLATNASLATQRFFIADGNYEISSISLTYATADGAANTAFISKEVNGQAPGAGVSVQTGTFNLNTTTNTPQFATLATRINPGFFGTGEPVISVKKGEMLSIKIASAVTSLAGLQVTILANPQPAYTPAVFIMNANGDLASQCFFLANRYLNVASVYAVVGTVASGAPTITLDVTKDTGTTAPAGGTTVLAAAMNVANTQVANTVITPALSATASVLKLAPGDRLAVKFTGTLTALAGVVVVVSFDQPPSAAGAFSSPERETCADFNLFKAANLGVDTSFFTAERDYLITDVSAIWSVAGGSGATVTVAIDTGTTAPGGGTTVITAIVATTTANTTNVGVLSVSRRNLLLPTGARLSVHYGGTVSPMAGLVVSVSMDSI